MGTVSFVRGDFVDAWRYTERVGGLYDPEQHRDLALIYGADPAVVCGLYGAKAQWMLGFPERAEATMGNALARVRDLRHGHTEAFALCYRGALAQYRRDIPLVLDSAKAAVAVASEHGIRQWLAWATILWGWALVLGGEHEEGIVRLQEGSAKWRITDRFALSYLLGLKAEALAVAGQVDEALDEFTQAVTLSDQQLQRFYLSELHRLKGGLLLKQERDTEAEKNLRRSVEVARQQQAKSPELRAALDLGKLWGSQGKVKAARTIISEAREGFTEGLDTPDLCAANSVLEELS